VYQLRYSDLSRTDLDRQLSPRIAPSKLGGVNAGELPMRGDAEFMIGKGLFASLR